MGNPLRRLANLIPRAIDRFLGHVDGDEVEIEIVETKAPNPRWRVVVAKDAEERELFVYGATENEAALRVLEGSARDTKTGGATLVSLRGWTIKLIELDTSEWKSTLVENWKPARETRAG